jgi:hypothetical protein
MGQYDTVLVLDAPDDASATALLMSLGKLGNVRAQTLRAFTAADHATPRRAPYPLENKIGVQPVPTRDRRDRNVRRKSLLDDPLALVEASRSPPLSRSSPPPSCAAIWCPPHPIQMRAHRRPSDRAYPYHTLRDVSAREQGGRPRTVTAKSGLGIDQTSALMTTSARDSSLDAGEEPPVRFSHFGQQSCQT